MAKEIRREIDVPTQGLGFRGATLYTPRSRILSTWPTEGDPELSAELLQYGSRLGLLWAPSGPLNY